MTASSRLSRKLLVNAGVCSALTYHLSDNPRGGNSRAAPALIEAPMTTKDGSARIAYRTVWKTPQAIALSCLPRRRKPGTPQACRGKAEQAGKPERRDEEDEGQGGAEG